MFNSSLNTLEQFKHILHQLPEGCYNSPCVTLSNSTIGQHTRHVIELYLCLIHGYEKADVSYDRRERNPRIENEVPFAIEQLEFIQEKLEKPNRDLKVTYELAGEENTLDSNYYREVMYNLEHAIHHHALIKVGIQHFTQLDLPESFGVAPSTMEYRKACAQ
ncbi:DinB family protein [Flagellimonas sp.]|uniref:DinB family protein n=1 Tax=Flagellimonas sp. TaxID=2058762 RepID=UPI003F4A29BA